MSLKFLNSEQVLEIHDEILRYSGGLPGESTNMPLDSVLGRIENNNLYKGIDNILQIAALYGVSIAQGHPFLDGNKRTAMVSMTIFLDLNGKELNAPEKEIEDLMVEVAQKKVNAEELAIWLGSYINEN